MTPALRNGASRRLQRAVVSSCALLGLFAPALAYGADEAFVLRARAAQLANKGDCNAALPLVDRARTLDPAGDGAASLMTGRCLISLERFAEAKPALERAVANDPASSDAKIALGVAKYHLGEKESAKADLEAALESNPDSPEGQLYLGMILLEQNQAAEAVNRLDRSRNLQGDTFEPAANYYAAMAQQQTGDAKRAEETLRNVQQSAPGTVWADRASEALAQADARSSAAPTRWLTLFAGLDYDTNVALRSGAVTQPSNISHHGDGRGWWGLDTGAELFRKNGWGGGVGGNYYGTQPFRETSFDQHFIGLSGWLDRDLGTRTLLRVSPELGYGFFDGHSLVRWAAIRPELRHDFGRAGMGTAYVRYAYNDFLYQDLQPFRGQRSRDGHEITAGYDHQIALTDTTILRGGGFGRDYRSNGTDYDFVGGGGWLGFRQLLPWKLIFDATGSVEYDKYDTRSSFAPPIPPAVAPVERVGDRHDIIGAASAVLTRPITSWLSVSARYQYLDNESNTRVFDYNRHVVGGFFTLQPAGMFRAMTGG